ncbi:MAG: AmmeMemoRadiSam system protein B [Prolixibacteraceae bacterium]|nr:AmmeMemoRadiSam system protein B [Prolixibacteraceae bacterium]
MTRWLTSQDREPEFAGRFYPGTKKELKNELSQLFLEAEKPKTSDKPQALISPHAGYVFSGQVAASAFNQIPDGAEYERVFVLASSHQMHFSGASVFTKGNYKTPLGTIRVDLELTKELSETSRIFSDRTDPHYFEHSLEVQLPFLQHKLGNEFLLVPIILGTQSKAEVKLIAKALEPWYNSKNLFVISTDFSHYPEYKDANEVDDITAEALVSGNPEKLLDTIESNRERRIPGLATSMCGWTSVLTLMNLTVNKKYRYERIQYLNSGDNPVYGGKDRVVGYHAIAVYQIRDDIFNVSEKEKQALLEIARRSLFDSYGLEKYNEKGLDLEGTLQLNLGAFVSLYNGKELRGCIGQFESDKPLFKVIKRLAVSSSNDRRFEKAGEEMVKNMTIEISVLSPLKKISSIDEIELGRHGIYLKKDFISGTFLPQVATKTGWDLEHFLGHCSRDKAGLGWDGWKDADLFVYEAEVFSNKQITD